MMQTVVELEAWYDQQVAGLQPFDCAAWLGYPAAGGSCYKEPQDLLMSLKEYQFRGALVSHTMSLYLDAISGNEAILEVLPGLSGCHGIMTLLPEGTGEFTNLKQSVEKYIEAGMRAARLFPREHRYTLRVPSMPPLMNLLQDLGVPLFIPIGQTSWDEIGNIAKQYPKLAILVEAVGHHEYLNMRAALPWLIAAPNLLVPTHNQFLCGGIELLVERIGAERIFFLTNQPFDDPAAALSHLMLSQISDSDKAKISFENSHRLLSQVARGGYFA